MKRNFVLMITIACFMQSAFGTNLPIDSKIEKVTVYRNGAFITRVGTAEVPAGNGTILVYGLSDLLDPESARISTDGDFDILSIRHQHDYLTQQEDNQEIKDLKEKRDQLIREQKRTQLDKQVFEEELKFLNSDKLISKENKELNVEQMNALMDFYRDRLKEIKLSILNSEEDLTQMTKELKAINNQISQYSKPRKKVSQFIVETYSTKMVKSNIELSYWTQNARWSSLYDIKMNDIKEPLSIQSNASLVNSTGEDWNEIDLTLSTGNPWRSMTIPTVSPWWIDFRHSYPSISMEKDGSELLFNMRSQKRMEANDSTLDEVKIQTMPLHETIVSENMTTMEFQIAGKWTIPSNHLPNTIKLETNSIDAKFRYVAVPAKSTYAFLQATIHDWQNMNFSYGEASLYFEGTYIGKTLLNPNDATDSLNISFGPDIAVAVSRQKAKEYSETKWFGTKKSETVGYSFEVRNHKGTAIDLMIQDNLPVSTNESITVDILNTGEATYQEETGILTWHTNLASGQTYRDDFAYKLTFPKVEVITSR